LFIAVSFLRLVLFDMQERDSSLFGLVSRRFCLYRAASEFTY
jgi:hypothetical protein